MFRYGLIKLVTLMDNMDSCRGHTPIVKLIATLWSRNSDSDGSEIESKNGFHEHHTSGVHNSSSFGGFEIFQRVRDCRAAGVRKEVEEALLYTHSCVDVRLRLTEKGI